MAMTLRQRIWLTLVPVLLLIVLVGAGGLVLLARLGDVALDSMVEFGAGLAVAVVLALIFVRYAARTILRQIQAVTQAARDISVGKPGQVVPYAAADELGQMAQAFNSMARTLHDYRKSHTNRIVRAQQISQATIDSSPDAIVVIDSEGHVEMANPAARRLLGVLSRQPCRYDAKTWQPPELLRQPIAEALRGERDYLPDGLEHVISFVASGCECTVQPRVLTIRDPNGAILGAAIFLHDVTRWRYLHRLKSGVGGPPLTPAEALQFVLATTAG